METETIKHNASQLGQILPSSLVNQAMKVKSLATNDCKECGKAYLKATLLGVCPQCQRKVLFEVLPLQEQELQIADVVRKRYLEATLDKLPAKLKEKLVKLPETEGLYIYGPTGTGKTFALAALARHYITQGFEVKRVGYEKLCLQIRDTFKPNSIQSEWGVIEPLLKCDKLIIEDISTTVSVGKQESDFALRVVLLIIDTRIEDCFPTLISGNKPVSELAKAFDSRIASRLRQGVIIQRTGTDKRAKEESSGR